MKFWIMFPIDFKVEREALYERLKHYIGSIESILNDDSIDYETKMKAASVLTQLIGKANKVITDAQLNEIQERMDELMERIKKLKEGR